MEIEKRIEELVNLINKASYEYYVLDRPTITDQEYDDYYNELMNIESKLVKIVVSKLEISISFKL